MADNETMDIIWQELETAALNLDFGVGSPEKNKHVVLSAIQLLMQLPAEMIVRRAEKSDLPTRALISWLVFEATDLDGVDPVKVTAIRAIWVEGYQSGQGPLIEPVKGKTTDGRV